VMKTEIAIKELCPSGITSSLLSGIRIARISTVPFFVLTQLKHQIEVICASGASVTIITSEGPELAALQALTGVTCKPIKIPRSIAPLRDVVALLRLFLMFKRDKIDIAHSTTPKAGLLTAVAAYFAGVPVRMHTFTGQPWVNMRGPVRWLTRSSDWLIGKLNTRCYADSESQRQFLIAQGVVSAQNLSVIGAGSLAGVDLTRFNQTRFSDQQRIKLRCDLGIPANVPILLFMGRITIEKGVRELMTAFRQLKSAGNAVHLVLAGPLDSGSGVVQEISRHEIEGVAGAHIVGYTECPETYMSIADILCLPSYREGFGTVVIEAAAMGVPAVGTDIYGLSDAVVNGETGVLVPPRDATALATALAKLLGNEKLRVEMGHAAKLRSEVLFDANLIDGKLIQECCDLLHRSKHK